MKKLASYFLFLFLIIGSVGLKGQTYKTSWLGNTYGYGDGQWVQNCITTLYVSPDGRCFTNSLWDEGHHETGIYSTTGAVLGNLFETQGLAITGDGTDIYVTHGNNPTSHLRKFQGSNTANRLWNVGVTGNSKLYDMVAKDGKIYATDPNNNRVIIYNTSDGSQTGTFSVTRPSEITIDNAGYLWIVQSAYSYAGNIPTPNSYIAAPKILRYSTTGVKQTQEIVDVVNPSDLAVDNSGRLMVAESGPDLQIRYYKNITTAPELDFTFGQQGGIYSGIRGEVQDTKFYKLNGLGVDQNNNLYVSLSGPNPKGDNPLYDTDLRKFNSSGQLEWKLLGKEFVDMGDVDPDDLTKFYTKDSRYTLNWNNMTAGSEWSYDAFTIDPERYPHDPRGSVKGSSGFAGSSAIENIFVRRIGGQKFMFGNGMAGGQGNLWIWRFNTTTDGEIAIPCGAIGSGQTAPNCPYTNEWIWRDLNGNGQCESNEYVSNPNSEYPYNNGMWPDKDGNVWRTYRDANPNIRKLVCSGLDANGIPQYSFTPRTTWNKPSVFQDVHYLRYFPETDRMFIAGWPTDNPPIGDQAEGVRCIARYNDWSTNPTLVWKSATVDYPELVTGMSFDIAGDYIFVAYFGDNDENNDPKNGTVYVYNTINGARYSKIEPGPEVGGTCGLIDIWDSGIRAVKKSGTNEYLIFLEEDGKAKTIIYRWCPTSDCFDITPEETTKYEAEDASLNGLTVYNNHAGYSGTGFVAEFSATGQYAQFSVTGATAGSQDIIIRYANGQTNARTLSLYVNDTKVRQVSFPVTSSWGTWADNVENVTLNAGNNTIRIQYDSGDLGQFNIDYISVVATIAVTGVSVTPATADIAVDGTQQLTTTVAPSNATNSTVTWSSSNTSVATVSTSGLVTGIAAGSATITATTQDQGKTATCTVTVTAPLITTIYEAENASLNGLTVYNNHAGYSGTGFVAQFSATGQYAQFSVTGATAGSQDIIIRYANGQTNARTLSLYVNDTKVRQVSFPVTSSWGTWADNVENVTLNAGNNTIRIQYDSGDLGQFNIDYISVVATIAVTGVSVTPATADIAVDGTQQLTTTVAPSNATNSTVTWSSSNTSVATVSTSGLVTGIAAGSATITATTQDQGLTATCVVSVISPKYEAEDASLNGLTVYNDHAGYSGTGFVAQFSAAGHYVQFLVTAAAGGNQNITIRYANGQTNARTLSLYVNGSKVRQVSFPVTTNWGTWADKVENVTLNAGNNTIKIQYDSGDLGQFNIDYLSLNGTGGMYVKAHVDDLQNETGILLYPNPAKTDLIISNVKPNTVIKVFSMDGKVIYNVIAETPNVDINVSKWEKGIYFFDVKTETTEVIIKAIIQ